MLEPVKVLNWSDTDEMYLNMSVNEKTGTIVVGDANGKVWIYEVKYILIKCKF